MKTTIISLLLLCLMACKGNELSDLRPAGIRRGYSQNHLDKAHELLSKLTEINGDFRAWQSYNNIRVEYVVDWPSVLKKTRASNSNRFRHIWAVGSDRSILTFKDGDDKENSLGIRSGLTYIEKKGEKPQFKDNEDIRFWLPTLQYFLEFVYRIREADVKVYAGEQTLNGKKYDLVLATWGKAEPQAKLDQYLLWLNKTGQLEYLQYTVRDKSPKALGTVHYKKWKSIGKLNFPFQFNKIKSLQEQNKVGTIRIKEVKLF